MGKIFEHIYIFLTIFFTVYSQLIMRWQISSSGSISLGFFEKIHFILVLMLNPWVLSGIFATFLAGVSWMLAMTKFEISYAYPFVSLNYVFVLIAGFIFFNESISVTKLVGSAFVVLGIIIISKG